MPTAFHMVRLAALNPRESSHLFGTPVGPISLRFRGAARSAGLCRTSDRSAGLAAARSAQTSCIRCTIPRWREIRMDAVPGQIFAVLADTDVELFRGDVRVVEAMLERWMASVAPTT